MSQCSRVLEVLRDNQPHSINEIHERAGTMRLNSRVSDLRKMGYFISYFRRGELHCYQLLETVQTGEVAADGVSASCAPRLGPPPDSGGSPILEADRVGVSTSAAPESPHQDPARGQLLIWEAA